MHRIKPTRLMQISSTQIYPCSSSSSDSRASPSLLLLDYVQLLSEKPGSSPIKFTHAFEHIGLIDLGPSPLATLLPLHHPGSPPAAFSGYIV